MDLILWRHAEAEDGLDDLARALTKKGQKQAEDMAAWLSKNIPKETRILASQALRSQQTARALSKNFEISAEINPGAHTLPFWRPQSGHITKAAYWSSDISPL